MKTLLLSLCLISTMAFAGHDTGGGGIGLKVGNQIQLYDFIESGIEDSVYIDNGITDEMKATTAVRSTLLISKSTQDLVIAKLNEIYKLSPTYAVTLLQTMKNYQWRFVKPALFSTGDLGRSPINVNLTQLQLAFRDDEQKTVTIDKDNLSKMSELHQVGLYFHEIIYALSGDQDSYKSRLLNSYLFHPSFQYATFEQLTGRVSLVQGKGYKILDYNTYIYINSSDYSKKCEELKTDATKFNVKALTQIQAEAKAIELSFRKADNSGTAKFWTNGGSDENDFKREFLNKTGFVINNITYAVPSVATFPMHTYRWIYRDLFPSSMSTFYTISQKVQDQFQALNVESKNLKERNDKDFFGNCVTSSSAQILKYISELNIIIN